MRDNEVWTGRQKNLALTNVHKIRWKAMHYFANSEKTNLIFIKLRALIFIENVLKICLVAELEHIVIIDLLKFFLQLLILIHVCWPTPPQQSTMQLVNIQSGRVTYYSQLDIKHYIVCDKKLIITMPYMMHENCYSCKSVEFGPSLGFIC